MTLEEADAVREDDVINRECEFARVEARIERRAIFFGEEAIIIAQISSVSHKLEQVIIQFKRMEDANTGACKMVLSQISNPLIEAYDPDFKKEGTEFVWYLTRGGKWGLRGYA